jgi:hypothetical protein
VAAAAIWALRLLLPRCDKGRPWRGGQALIESCLGSEATRDKRMLQCEQRGECVCWVRDLLELQTHTHTPLSAATVDHCDE